MSINNVAFAEVMSTALAYFQAGRNEEGFKLLKAPFWTECTWVEALEILGNQLL